MNTSLIDPTFLDKYNKNNTELNLVEAVISVMAKHIYESSNIYDVVSIKEPNNNPANANQALRENGYDKEIADNTENLISVYGIKILEKLIDEKEVLRMIKAFKDLVSAYVPDKSLPDLIIDLEKSLLFFFCVLQVPRYFFLGLTEIIEALKSLIKKEITFIENFKKDNLSENKKDEKYQDCINSSHKRLYLQTAILLLISEKCMRIYEDTIKKDGSAQARNGKTLGYLKEILKILTDFFDKSSDEANVLELLKHLNNNISFLLTYESELNTTEVDLSSNTKNSAFSFFGANKKEAEMSKAKFDETIIEKLTANLTNLLRKNIDNDNISASIITTFEAITRKKAEICDLLVKLGCPRLLMQILENTQDLDLAKKAMQLLKILTFSSDENLQMISKQSNK